VTKAPYKSEALAAQLSVVAKNAMRNANFNGFAWALIAPAGEVSDLRIALALARFEKDQVIITNRGMGVRAVISRTTPSARFVGDST
jgi:hypothetical protein